MSQFAEFAKGKMKGVSLSREGVLAPGLALNVKNLLASGQPSLWSLARANDGTIYVGAGPTGRVLSWRAGADKLEDLGAPATGHVFALAVDAKNVVYAGVSPGGAVYRRVNAKWELVAQTGEAYVWSMLFAPDGALYVGTGNEGKLWRIEGTRAELWWASGQANLTSLAVAKDGSLLVGSDPNGMLYRVSAKNTARALFDAPFGEIRSLVAGESGEMYFLGMGGLAARRAPAASAGSTSTGSTPQVTTTITVTEEAAAQVAAQVGSPLAPKPASAVPTAAPSAAASAAALDIPGLDRSAIYRLNADLTVDPLYITKEESIFDLAWHAEKIHFVSDQRGRVYRLDAPRQASLLLESGEQELSRLQFYNGTWLGLSSTAGRLLEFPQVVAGEGEYESPVHEAPALAKWGRLEFEGEGKFTWQARTGNTVLPDETWSAWANLADMRIAAPTAKYAQWRLRSEGAFALRKVAVHYLPRNQAPQVKSITAVLSASAAAAPSTSLGASASAVYSLTVTDTGEASSATSSGTGTLAPTRPLLKQLLLSWTSEDPDGDALDYRVEYRGEEESRWKLLEDELKETNYALDADTLADGRFLFRVTARDAAANTMGAELEGQLTSVPVVLDQTAPELKLNLAGGRLQLEASDAMSAIRRLEISVNGKPWRGIAPADGLPDERTERATVEVNSLGLVSGENILTVRAYDAALNVAVKKLRVER
ncbi:MAG: hypothetical protein NW208_10560 [Bryobacter sp.]|nr:hypothetical protein [Bryobacter sp.]